jgi:hypothetical protein
VFVIGDDASVDGLLGAKTLEQVGDDGAHGGKKLVKVRLARLLRQALLQHTSQIVWHCHQLSIGLD